MCIKNGQSKEYALPKLIKTQSTAIRDTSAPAHQPASSSVIKGRQLMVRSPFSWKSLTRTVSRPRRVVVGVCPSWVHQENGRRNGGIILSRIHFLVNWSKWTIAVVRVVVGAHKRSLDWNKKRTLIDLFIKCVSSLISTRRRCCWCYRSSRMDSELL